MNLDLLGPNGEFPIPDPDPRPPFPPVPPLPEFWERPPLKIFELEKIRWPIRYGPAEVKILVLIDSGGSYDTGANFGLGIMLRDAFNVGLPAADPLPPDYPDYARFKLTLAHRTNAAGVTPGFDSFTFSDASLAGFHEVWLFGVSNAAPYLQGAELAALTKFMNDGGGVFATGDHEDLGLGLCGNVPRVKSMRKWWYVNGRPPGEPQAPDSTDLTRNDTVQLIGGMDPGFSGEGDSTPQPVYLNYRYGHNWWSPRRWFRHPHPVLCGPRGAITVFPDHPHEGDCIVPASLDATEYPGGLAPEVIARGRNVVGRNKNGFIIADPREFGLVGTYDGHRPEANIGRVVVDATWHHWFNVNLRGLDDLPRTVKYLDILAYYRNLAVWLAPKERQARMRKTGLVIGLFTQAMIERTLTIRELRPELFYVIGIEARDALGRLAPQCQVSVWIWDLITTVLPEFRKRFEHPMEVAENPDAWEAFVLDRVLITALGGAMSALALATRESNHREADKAIEGADEIAVNGLRAGLEQAQRELASARRRFDMAITTTMKGGTREKFADTATSAGE